MSFPQALRAPARSAYRDVLRSARVTFHGDPDRHLQLLTALRVTFSSPTLTAPGQPTPPPSLDADGPPADPKSPEELQKRIQEWKDVAEFLRKNVVQGRRNPDTGVYKLRVTEHTELGDNDEIKAPKPLPVTPFPNRNKNRRRVTAVETPCGGSA